MKSLFTTIAISSLAFSACRVDEGSPAYEVSRDFPSNEKVMAMAYDNTYTVSVNILGYERAYTTRC